VAAAPGAGGHAVGRGGAPAVALSRRGASGVLPRSEQRVNAAVRRPGLGRSARRGGSRRTTGPRANAEYGVVQRGNGARGSRSSLGMRPGAQTPRAGAGAAASVRAREHGRGPALAGVPLFKLGFLQKFE
jgi:hypothetical protein